MTTPETFSRCFGNPDFRRLAISDAGTPVNCVEDIHNFRFKTMGRNTCNKN